MENKLEIEENGKIEKYNILLNVETKEGNGNYILYTKNEKNDIGEIIVYAGIMEKEDDKVKISPIVDDEKLEFLSDLLSQIQNQVKE